jgi:hypothetical protein
MEYAKLTRLSRVFSQDTTTWDENRIFGCICDSTWTVGLASGQTQQPEYFGPDCSLSKELFIRLPRSIAYCILVAGRCPTGDDPRTESTTETDCSNVVADGGFGTGATNNLCHVDCSNRGTCNYATGECKCFKGYTSANCGTIISNANVLYYNERQGT